MSTRNTHFEDSVKQRVQTYLRSSELWVTAATIAAGVEAAHSPVTEALRKLEREGKVERKREGKETFWRWVDDGGAHDRHPIPGPPPRQPLLAAAAP